MVDFLEGLGQVAQALNTDPGFQRYLMYRQGIAPEIVEPQMERLARTNRAVQLEEQERQRRQSLARQIQERAGELTPQEIFQIGAQDAELGRLAATLYKQNLEAQQQGAFQGTSMDAQIANLAYQEGMAMGLDDFGAKKYAADKVQSSKMDLRVDPMTGQLTSIPRKPIFGGGGIPSAATQPDPYSIPENNWQPDGEPMPITDDMIRQPEQPQAGYVRELVNQAQGPIQGGKTLLNEAGGLVSDVLEGFGADEAAASIRGSLPLEATESRQRLSTIQGDVVRALSLNPRMPVAEIKRILAENPIQGTSFSSTTTKQAKLDGLVKELTAGLQSAEQAASDESLPIEQRKQAMQSARMTRELIQKIGMNENVKQPQQQPAAGGSTGLPEGWSVRVK